jgi:serine/threonine protein kinase/tetratricopeptide (TPR) repeat protein
VTIDPSRFQAILSAVLACDDAASRAAVLDRECSADSELRRWIEALLASGNRLGLTIAAPAPREPLTETAADFSETAHSSSVSLGETAYAPTDFGNVAPDERTIVSNTMYMTSEAPGATIGPYKLTEPIGEGGMGTVYLAEQEKPVRRRVALKIIKPGMDSKQVIARFEAERQALAMMDHQNIARVLDAGATESGRPYFVMELVHGVPITQYCDEARLTPRERLELFIPVCRAIQHAHQKGIIHRDVKPSNVLVTVYDGEPVPKVIDFGIAKAIEQELTERTIFTQYGAIVGTFEYMSPEQAEPSAAGIDTRTDIYSLGVLLYELLTGSTPLERVRLCEAGYSEILKRIKEEEPQKPSTRLSSCGDRLPELSDQRNTEPAQLPKIVRGELDWIVMKALEKDRARRYESASSFASDLEHFLKDEPVEACPPSAGYRLRKLARKHRMALATTTGFAALLVIGAFVSTWQAIRATIAEGRATRQFQRAIVAEVRSSRERDRAVAAEAQAKLESQRAQRSASEAQAVLKFFEDHVLAAARPEGQEGGLGKDVTLRAAVDAAEPKVADAFQKQPTIEAHVRSSMGTTYRYLGEPALAVREHERALALRKAAFGADHPETLAAQSNLALAYRDAGRLDLAIPLYEQTLAAQAAKLGADHPDTLATQHHLALAYKENGRLDLAVPLFEKTLEARKIKVGPNHPDTLTSQNDLALAYRDAGRLDRAIPLLEQTLAARRAAIGADHPDTLTSQGNLALVYKDNGRLDLAIPLYERTLAARAAKLGAQHPGTLATENNLAAAYRAAGQFARAIPLLERTLAARIDKLGELHPDVLASQFNLAVAYRDAGHYERAVALLEKTLATRKSKLGPDHPDNLSTQTELALTYRDAGQFDRAIALFEQTLADETARLGAEHPNTLLTQNNLALALRDDGQWDRAIALFEKTLATRKARLGPDHPDTLLTQHNLAMAYREAGRWERAIALFEQTLSAQASRLGPEHPYTLLTQNNLGPAYQAVGQVDRAIALLEQTLAARTAKLGPDHSSTLSTQNNLALAYQASGQLDRAIALFEHTLAARTATQGRDHPRTLTTLLDLAIAYEARGDLPRAESMLRDVVAAQKQKFSATHPYVAESLSALGAVLLQAHKPSDAEPVLREALEIWDAKRPGGWSRFHTQARLGESLLDQKKYADAEPLLISGYEGMKARTATIPAPEKDRLGESGKSILKLYDTWGKPAKAAEWRAKLRDPAQ